MQGLPVYFEQRHIPAVTSTRQDVHYPTLICNVVYGTAGAGDTLQRRIDSVLSIRPVPIVISTQAITISFLRQWRLDSLEIIGSPALWSRSELKALPADVEDVFVDFGVSLDLDNRFSTDIEIDVGFDELAGSMAITDKRASLAGVWRALANNLFIRSDEGRFCELRLTHLGRSVLA